MGRNALGTDHQPRTALHNALAGAEARYPQRGLAHTDNILHLAVVDRDLSAPPPDPAEGARYIVAAGGEGAWAGQDGKIAAWQDGAWAFATPRPGWLAWIIDEVGLFYRTVTGWENLATALAGLQNLALLGIGTTADAANPSRPRSTRRCGRPRPPPRAAMATCASH